MNNKISNKWTLAVVGLIWSFFSYSAELQNFSWSSSSNYVNDRGVTYTFEYTLVTDAPTFIFYGLAYGRTYFDSTSVGNPIDLNKVSVTINGSPAAINASGSYNYGSGMYIRLVDPSVPKANDQIKVTIQDIKHGSSAGTSNWQWIRTASGGGHAIDEVSNPDPIVLVNDNSIPEELINFTWYSSSNIQSEAGVTYTFEYELVTSEPYSIFHAQAYEAINTTVLNNPIDINKAIVTIDGQPAPLDVSSSASYNLGTGVTLRLQNPALATAGSSVKVVLHDIKNGDSLGIYNWQYINTAKRSGHPVDEVSTPQPIVLVEDSTTPLPNLTDTQFNTPSTLIPDSQSMGSWAVIPVDLTDDQQKDLLVSHYLNGTSGIASVLNNGDGTFSLNQFQTGDSMGGAYGLTFGDVNADGLMDAVSAGPNGDNYTFINEGSSTAPNFSYGYKVGDTNNTYFYGQRMAHGDLDKDGYVDMVWAGSGDTVIGYGPWENNQYSAMMKVTSSDVSVEGSTYDVVISDIDSDGDDDIIKIRGAGVSDYNGGIQILINNLNRNYTEINYNASNTGPIFAQENVELNPIWGGTGDFDMNGTQDIAFFNVSDSQDKVFIGLNSADAGDIPQFSFHSIDLDIYSLTTQIDFTKGFVEDINNDGYLDIITSGYYTKTFILLGRGDGTFEVDKALPNGQVKAVDDIDFNGSLDLVLDTYDGLEIYFQDKLNSLRILSTDTQNAFLNHNGEEIEYTLKNINGEVVSTWKLTISEIKNIIRLNQLDLLDSSNDQTGIFSLGEHTGLNYSKGLFQNDHDFGSQVYELLLSAINELYTSYPHAIEGEWFLSGGKDPFSINNMSFTINIPTMQQVSIELTSSIVDTYLYITDRNGNPIFEDDDGAGGFNSRITATLDSGTYRVIAATYSEEESGWFDLISSGPRLIPHRSSEHPSFILLDGDKPDNVPDGFLLATHNDIVLYGNDVDIQLEHSIDVARIADEDSVAISYDHNNFNLVEKDKGTLQKSLYIKYHDWIDEELFITVNGDTAADSSIIPPGYEQASLKDMGYFLSYAILTLNQNYNVRLGSGLAIKGEGYDFDFIEDSAPQEKSLLIKSEYKQN